MFLSFLSDDTSVSCALCSCILGRLELSSLKSYHRGRSCQIQMRQLFCLSAIRIFSESDLRMINSIYGGLLSSASFFAKMMSLIHGDLLAAVSFLSYSSLAFSPSWYYSARCDILVVRRSSFPSSAVFLVGTIEIPLYVPSLREMRICAKPTNGRVSCESGG